MDRKGWVLPLRPLREAWRAGARLAVVPRRLVHEEVKRWLADTGTVVFSTLDADIVRLARKTAQP